MEWHGSKLQLLAVLLLCLMVQGLAPTQLHARRKVLLEIFSTELCNNCPQAHKNIERLFGDGGDSIIFLGHHSGFYTDGFTLPESVDYEWFYTPDRGTYAPAAMMNRTCDAEGLPEVFKDGVPVFDGARASCLQPAYAMAAGITAPASIRAAVRFDAEERTLTVTASGELLNPLPTVNDMRLNLFLTEDSVFTQTQSGAYGQYYHRHLARHCFTGAWGEAVATHEEFCQTYTLRVPDEWDAQRISVIAFVTNYNPNDRNNCEVLNATSVPLLSALAPEAISDTREDAGAATHYYNIYGQDMRQPGKGLHIANGTKIILQ